MLRAVYRIDGTGWERIPASGPAVLAANHESQLDPFVMGVATLRVIHYMAKAELWDHPVLRRLVEGFGAFPVQRGLRRRGALDHGLAMLQRGELVGIFPQGTCHPAPPPPWRSGAARLAKEKGVPLVPVCLVNSERVLRPRKFKIGFPQFHDPRRRAASTRLRHLGRVHPGRPRAGSRSSAGPTARPRTLVRLLEPPERLAERDRRATPTTALAVRSRPRDPSARARSARTSRRRRSRTSCTRRGTRRSARARARPARRARRRRARRAARSGSTRRC